MSEDEVNMSAVAFFSCIIVSVLVGAAITHVAGQAIERRQKETNVVRDASGRVQSVTESYY